MAVTWRSRPSLLVSTVAVVAGLALAMGALVTPARALTVGHSAAMAIPTAHAPGSVWGVVHDNQIETLPKAGVTVTLQRWDVATNAYVDVSTAVSDVEGYFEFTGLSQGTYTVIYPLPGDTENSQNLYIDSDGASAPATYRSSADRGARWIRGFLPQGNIEGQGIVEGTGQVVLQRWNSVTPGWADVRFAHAGFFGGFTFRNLPSGTFRVTYLWTGDDPTRAHHIEANGVTLRDSNNLGITVDPSLTGRVVAGSTLNATIGSGALPRSAKRIFQWYQGTNRISSAVKSSYTLRKADVGAPVSVVAGVSYGLAEYTAHSAATRLVPLAGTPKIVGRALVGRTLRVSPGRWTAGTTYSYAWYANGRKLTKGWKSTFKVTAKQRNKKITVKVTGKKTGYAAVVKTSKPTPRVR